MSQLTDDELFAQYQVIPYVCLYSQLDRAFSSLQVENMKSVEHEDTELNNDYSVDPLADPRLDKMDLFNMVDTEDRDRLMNSQSSYDVGSGEFVSDASPADSPSESGSGE